MTFLHRLRINLAIWLCKGTVCLVARADGVVQMHDIAYNLAQYVGASGGLQDPRRIKAYCVIFRAALALTMSARTVIVGPQKPVQPPVIATPTTEELANGTEDKDKEKEEAAAA